MQANTIADDQLLPDFYHVLSVDYHASPDTIKEAFMALTNDIDTFYLYKEMVRSFSHRFLTSSTDNQICDAFMCLASSGDRAAYDAFYYKTTCWYSKKLWLQYRDERRRLDWDDDAKKNADYLADIQQAVMTAFEASLAGDPVGGHAAEKKAAMALSRKTHRCRRPRHHRKETTETSFERKMKQLKKEVEDRDRALEERKKKEEEIRKEKEREQAALQKSADDKSDSGHSEFTLIEVAEAAGASPAERIGQLAIGPVPGLAVADGVFCNRVYEMQGVNPNMVILPSNTSPETFLQGPVPSKRIKADSAAQHATDPAASELEQPEAIATKHAGDTTRTAASVAKPAHVPAHSKTQTEGTPVAKPGAVPAHPKTLKRATAAATATRMPPHLRDRFKRPEAATTSLVPGKTQAAPISSANKISTPTTMRTARAARSTATAMTASAASKAKPAQRPAPETAKQPPSIKPLRRPTAPTASSIAKEKISRSPLPERTGALAQKRTQSATGSPTASSSRAAATPAARTSTAAPGKSSNVPATSIKRGMASSRWAQPQTCANGQPGHPRTLGNWKRLPLMGKCTACGCASHGKSAPAPSRHLYWCGMCNASFCNECYITNVLRRQ